MRGGRCWCWWFCGWLDYQEKKNFGAVGGSELELVMYDRLVLTRVDQLSAGQAWSGVQ